VDGCDDIWHDEALMKKLEGRPRLTTRIVTIINDENQIGTKSEILRDIIERSFTHHRDTIATDLLQRAKADRTIPDKAINDSLISLALAISFDDKYAFSVPHNGTIDFINAGICRPKKLKSDESIFYTMDEPLSRAIVSVYLLKYSLTISDAANIALCKLLSHSVISSQEKGKLIEKVIVTALVKPNAMKRLLEHPDVELLNNSADISWAKTMQFTTIKQISGVNSIETELQILSDEHNSGTVLLPSHLMGPDIICMNICPSQDLPQVKHKTQTLQPNLKFDWVIFGVKTTLDGNMITKRETENNFLQMDPNYAYCKDRELNKPPKIHNEAAYTKYKQLRKNVVHTLFVEICLPKPATVTPPGWTNTVPFIRINIDNIQCLLDYEPVCKVVKSVYNGSIIPELPLVFERDDDGQPQRKRFKGDIIHVYTGGASEVQSGSGTSGVPSESVEAHVQLQTIKISNGNYVQALKMLIHLPIFSTQTGYQLNQYYHSHLVDSTSLYVL
jgi:hypothetical protein